MKYLAGVSDWTAIYRKPAGCPGLTLRGAGGKGQGRFRWAFGVLAVLCLALGQMAFAQAPLRPGQPYAEVALCARADVILCEDFDYPQNFTWDGNEPGTEAWNNSGLISGTFNFVYGVSGRRLNPASTYPTKPQDMRLSGSQPDGVWAANWDPSNGAQANGARQISYAYVAYGVVLDWTIVGRNQQISSVPWWRFLLHCDRSLCSWLS